MSDHTLDAYHPTHRVPHGGLQAFDAPDPNRPVAAQLASNLDVQLVRWWGEWAEIRCSNGWSAWVAGRRLVLEGPPPPPTPAPAPAVEPTRTGPPDAADAYRPTHRVPPGGLQAFDAPDPNRPVAAELASNLDVQLVRWWGDWAEIRCSNGWSAWVAGRRLSEDGPATRAAPSPGSLEARLRQLPLPAGVSPLAAAGAALAIIGSFLPWISVNVLGSSVSSSAWDVPIWFVLTGDDALSGFDTGLVLLLGFAAVVVPPYVTRRPLDERIVLGVGLLMIGVAAMMFLRIVVLEDLPGVGVGFGVVVTVAGGAMLVVAFLQERQAAPQRRAA